PTAALPIDRLLEGGLHTGEVTTVFGEAATGKSTLAYQSLINVAKMEHSTIYIDTEHKFNTRRIAQIDDKTDVSDFIALFQPETFTQQIQYLKNLKALLNERPFKLLIIDTISNLYRLESCSIEKSIALRRLLEQHLARIYCETRRYSLFTLILSQVRSFKGKTTPIGEDCLYAYSRKLVELRKGLINNKRFAILRKGRSNMIDESLPYVITEKGFSSINEIRLLSF
ncbi:ATPase domain-containing protein, partial [Candidatus Borrarchaeum sp.]|uniref:ATPase domain-containing protein n=1 Tax=Candidatus Borrarchaeum sp. TaxID=2846742 RepID=UPI00257FC5F6